MAKNIYAHEDAQPLFVWGTDWRRHETYSTIPEVHRELGLEDVSRVIEPKIRRTFETRSAITARQSRV